MTQRPVWLRQERSYRAYIRGLRYTLLTAALAVLSGVLGFHGLTLLFLLAAFPLAVIGMVGWIMVPDKNRANLHQLAFLAMVGHDIFKGIPRDNQNGVVVR